MNRLKGNIKKIFIGGTSWLCFCVAHAGFDSREFEAPLGKERWSVSTSRLRCGMSLRVKDYGIAYFEQFATKDPHFLLTNWQNEKLPTRAKVWTYPPQWKPEQTPALISNTTLTANEFAVFLGRNPTLKMLASLTEGYKTRISYKSNLGYKMAVNLSPVNFQKVYSAYVRCVGNLLPFDYDDIKLSVFHFNNDGHGLTDDDEKQLNRIRTYVRLDRKVKQVYITGYTDNVGRRGVNNAISELRAKAVMNYLLDKGLPREKVSVTWYGQDNPVVSNATEAGRAKNRRVVIRVVR